MELVIKETLQKLLEVMGLSYTGIQVTKESDNTYVADIETPESSLLIGRHGDTLAALQYLLKSLLLRQGVDADTRAVLDVDGYKKRQAQNAIQMAERKADYVIKVNKPLFLPPMNPYLRRKVHLHLANHDSFKEKVTTQSVGVGPRRQLKIIPKSA